MLKFSTVYNVHTAVTRLKEFSIELSLTFHYWRQQQKRAVTAHWVEAAVCVLRCITHTHTWFTCHLAQVVKLCDYIRRLSTLTIFDTRLYYVNILILKHITFFAWLLAWPWQWKFCFLCRSKKYVFFERKTSGTSVILTIVFHEPISLHYCMYIHVDVSAWVIQQDAKCT